jgi:putative transposase
MSTVSVGLEGVKGAYRRERDPKLKERMRMVIGILEGLSSYEVADRLIVPRPNVSYWKRRFEKEGLEGLRDRPRSGRPPKVKRWKMERVRRMVEGKGYWTAKEVMRLVREETGAEYSLMHVTRILHGWGFSRKKAGKRHVNAASRRQVKRFKKGP